MNGKILGILGVAIILIVLIIIVGFTYTDTPEVSVNTATSTIPAQSTSTDDGRDTDNLVLVTPISHATAVLTWGAKTIYTDPVGSSTAFVGKKPANIILITDIHPDHLSTTTLAQIGGTATLIVPQAVVDLLPTSTKARAKVLKNNETITEQGFQISAIPMYNIPETADARHTKGRGNGYIVERDGYRVYLAGDTGNTPEMRALTDIDIAFVPMNLPFTMSVEDAAKAVLAFKPLKVYPYHYRGQNGLNDVNKFKQLVDASNQNIEVVLLNWYPQ